MAESETVPTEPAKSGPAEYTGDSRSARKRARSSRRSTRTRRLYFGLTAFWGFAVGAAAVALAQAARGTPLQADIQLTAFTLIAAAIAVAGGMIGAAAYREARRRRR